MESIEVWQWAVGQLVIAAAIWGGIRVDIKNMHRRIDELHEDMKGIHKRVDTLFGNGHSGAK